MRKPFLILIGVIFINGAFWLSGFLIAAILIFIFKMDQSIPEMIMISIGAIGTTISIIYFLIKDSLNDGQSSLGILL